MTTTNLPDTDVINAATLRQLRSQDPDIRILDVRTGGEFETVHIPGSYNVPLDTLGEHVRDLADVEHPVVLVCQSGGRATQAHGQLTSAGKDTLHILEGGICLAKPPAERSPTATPALAMDRRRPQRSCSHRPSGSRRLTSRWAAKLDRTDQVSPRRGGGLTAGVVPVGGLLPVLVVPPSISSQ